MRSALGIALATVLSAAAGCPSRPTQGAAPGPTRPVRTPPRPPSVIEWVTITKQPARVGHRRIAQQRSNVRFILDFGSGEQRFATWEAEERHEEVLALQGSTITRLRVRFVGLTEESVKNGAKTTKPQPLLGKTFVLERSGGQTVVTDPAGKPVPAATAGLVRKKYRSFGKPNHMYQALRSRPLQVGSRQPALEAAFRKSMLDSLQTSNTDRWTVANVSMTLTGKKRLAGVEVAVFALAFEATMERAPRFSTTMYLKGEIYIRTRDGWSAGSDLKGPMDIMGVPEAGDVHLVETSTYH